eukprot:58710-Karenia_brevis.AAC.1
MWWRCPAWQGARSQHLAAIQAFDDAWPPCLRLCGIMPSDMPNLQGTLAYAATAPSSENEDAHIDLSVHICGREVWSGGEPLHSEDWAIVYTDGSCIGNQDARFRRAG